MNAIWVYTKFVGIWFGGAVLAAWWSHFQPEVAIFAGLCLALFWRLWVRLEAGEAEVRSQLRELHFCIEDPSCRQRIKEMNCEAGAVAHAIGQGYLKKGMTPSEINQALRRWGEKYKYQGVIPSVEPRVDPDRLVPRKATRKKAAIFHQSLFGDPSPELWLEFRDDKLTGWKIKNRHGLPTDLQTPWPKLYQAAKKDQLSRQAILSAKDDEQP